MASKLTGSFQETAQGREVGARDSHQQEAREPDSLERRGPPVEGMEPHPSGVSRRAGLQASGAGQAQPNHTEQELDNRGRVNQAHRAQIEAENQARFDSMQADLEKKRQTQERGSPNVEKDEHYVSVEVQIAQQRKYDSWRENADDIEKENGAKTERSRIEADNQARFDAMQENIEKHANHKNIENNRSNEIELEKSGNQKS